MGANSLTNIRHQQVAPNEGTASNALAVATARLNDAVHNHVVTFAARNGSTTPPDKRFIHYNNATAKAIGLKKSNATVIAALPIEDRAILALIRQGVAARIPTWTIEAEREGGVKPHNRIRKLAEQWADLEVKALRACGIEEVIARAATLVLENAA